MELTKFILKPNIEINGIDNLYCRFCNDAKLVDEHIELNQGSCVSFDTFYNLISNKYFYYCNIKNPYILIDYQGSLTVELHLRIFINDIVLSSTDFESSNRVEDSIKINIDKIDSKSFLYLKIISKANNSVFYGGSFNCDNISRDIKLGVVICTFKRESFVKSNLNILNKYLESNPKLQNKLSVFVVDNGKTLDKKDLPNFVNLIPNNNTGGSGGFTRGLKEIIKIGGFSHFLFMDDDISFEPSVLNRTITLLSILKDEYKNNAIGGAMLIKDNPTIQHEFGAFWTGRGFKPNGEGKDLSKVYGLLSNEDHIKVDYNAWWYCCMPVNVVDKNGLPLELLFVQYDDVEYGVRCKTNFININGIGVWHENFQNKYNPAYEYFVKRNRMIVISRHSHNSGMFVCWLKYVIAIAKALFQQRYYIIDIINLAYNDFLKGAEYVKNIDSINKLKELSQFCPVQRDATLVANELGLDFDSEVIKTNNKPEHRVLEVLNLNSYLLPKCTYDEYRVVNMAKNKPIDFYKAKRIVHYNKYTQKAFVTEIDKRMLLKGITNINKMFFKMLFKFRKARDSYRNL